MIIKLLGIIDVFIALTFWIYGIFDVGLLSGLIYVLAIYLIIKGLIFLTQLSIASILDIACALVILSSVTVNMPNIVVIIVSLFLIQKGIFSMLG
ncbi:MAG: hypothetical protein Q8N99_02675 [Nanoarchaeota archaeon]|nr:hypothetical protein [Nanoarchaeota archaeon]